MIIVGRPPPKRPGTGFTKSKRGGDLSLLLLFLLLLCHDDSLVEAANKINGGACFLAWQQKGERERKEAKDIAGISGSGGRKIEGKGRKGRERGL